MNADTWKDARARYEARYEATMLSPSLPAVDGRPQLWRVSSDEYYAMAEAGFFMDAKAELINGIIYRKAKISPRKAYCISRATELLHRRCGDRWAVLCQCPLSLSHDSEPEPSVALVSDSLTERAVRHPATAALVLEICDCTLPFLRDEKTPIYAAAQIPDFWILDVPARQLQVRRDPQPDASAPFGFSYGTLQTPDATSRVSPLCAPDVSLLVSDLLPLEHDEADESRGEA